MTAPACSGGVGRQLFGLERAQGSPVVDYPRRSVSFRPNLRAGGGPSGVIEGRALDDSSQASGVTIGIDAAIVADHQAAI